MGFQLWPSPTRECRAASFDEKRWQLIRKKQVNKALVLTA